MNYNYKNGKFYAYEKLNDIGSIFEGTDLAKIDIEETNNNIEELKKQNIDSDIFTHDIVFKVSENQEKNKKMLFDNYKEEEKNNLCFFQPLVVSSEISTPNNNYLLISTFENNNGNYATPVKLYEIKDNTLQELSARVNKDNDIRKVYAHIIEKNMSKYISKIITTNLFNKETNHLELTRFNMHKAYDLLQTFNDQELNKMVEISEREYILLATNSIVNNDLENKNIKIKNNIEKYELQTINDNKDTLKYTYQSYDTKIDESIFNKLKTTYVKDKTVQQISSQAKNDIFAALHLLRIIKKDIKRDLIEYNTIKNSDDQDSINNKIHKIRTYFANNGLNKLVLNSCSIDFGKIFNKYFTDKNNNCNISAVLDLLEKKIKTVINSETLYNSIQLVANKDKMLRNSDNNFIEDVEIRKGFAYVDFNKYASLKGTISKDLQVKCSIIPTAIKFSEKNIQNENTITKINAQYYIPNKNIDVSHQIFSFLKKVDISTDGTFDYGTGKKYDLNINSFQEFLNKEAQKLDYKQYIKTKDVLKELIEIINQKTNFSEMKQLVNDIKNNKLTGKLKKHNIAFNEMLHFANTNLSNNLFKLKDEIKTAIKENNTSNNTVKFVLNELKTLQKVDEKLYNENKFTDFLTKKQKNIFVDKVFAVFDGEQKITRNLNYLGADIKYAKELNVELLKENGQKIVIPNYEKILQSFNSFTNNSFNAFINDSVNELKVKNQNNYNNSLKIDLSKLEEAIKNEEKIENEEVINKPVIIDVDNYSIADVDFGTNNEIEETILQSNDDVYSTEMAYDVDELDNELDEILNDSPNINNRPSFKV
ncbi:hypothetical protein [Campylobacter canadensis]|uniref:hypothetical protein n=1 Tax=Campylobacter canadensis TaxID=449520 RepID=UPI001CCE1BE5|nr:hypothetical protein [Campylobacter canadensis]MBZ8002357.1 hypothetical protein [Campylobacter canadensis]